MSTITTRSGKGAPLTNNEVDSNFTNLNADKAELSGATFTGEITANGGIALGDNDKATFGNGDDLQIYHDGSASYVTDTGTGDLILQGTNIQLRSASTKRVLQGIEAGATKIFYDNAEKLATTSTGIDVTGTVTADGLTVGDNQWIYAGNGADLKIGHDGSDSIIRSQGVPLVIDANGTIFRGYSPYTKHMDIASNGDISFYEDTGTTPKFVWSSSAEKLTLSGTGGLDVNTATGSVNIQAGSASADIALGIGSPSTANKVVVTAGGSVGIGTSSPAAPLAIKSSSASSSTSGMLIQANGNTNTVISMGEKSTDGGRFHMYDGGVEKIAFYTDGTASHISAGNVGIGTSTPSQMLELSADNGSGVANVLRFNDAATGVSSGQTTGRIEFAENDGGNTTVSAFLEVDTVSTSGGGVMTFGTGSAGVTATEAMRIDSSGRLLVGTTNVGYSGVDLTVGDTTDSQNGLSIQTSTTGNGYLLFGDGSGAASYRGQINYKHGDDYMAFSTANTEAMRIDSSGRVGIGTSSPDARVKIVGDDTASGITLRLDGGGVQTQRGIVFAVGGADYGFINIPVGGGGAMSFGTGSAGAAAERMRIDSSGNVGIGTSSPPCLLYVASVANPTAIPALGAASTHFAVGNSNSYGTMFGTLNTGNGYIQQQRFDTVATAYNLLLQPNGGNVGIGTTTPNGKLTVSNGSGAHFEFFPENSTDTNLFMNYDRTSAAYQNLQTRAATHQFLIGDSEKMRIDASGNLLVGTTAASGTFTLVANQYNAMSIQVSSNGNVGASWKNASGSEVGYVQVNASATLYSTSSDERLKENITDANDAGDKIDAIQVRQYDWKADGSHQDYGMVAQELMTVAPEAVSGDPESDEMMGVDYSKLVPMLIKEIQSLRNRVAQLEA